MTHEDSGLEEKLKILQERSKKSGFPNHLKSDTLPTAAEIYEIRKDLRANHSPELEFEFIKVCNGLRKKENTVIMAPIGRGKSTLSKTLISVLCSSGKKVFVMLSEDKTKQYLTMTGLDYKYKDNLQVISEKSQLRTLAKSKASFEDRLDSMTAYIITLLNQTEFNPDYIFFDNIHTSRFYNASNEYDIMHFFDCFEELSERYNCANIFYAHVATTSRDKIPLEPEDIRGFKTINFKAHHIGALYMAGLDRANGEKPRLCFHWVKSRTQPRVTGLKFALFFDEDSGMYYDDKELDWDTFCHFWKKQKNKPIDSVKAVEALDKAMKEAEKLLKSKSFLDII